MRNLYIIIVTYNAARWLDACLESVRQQIGLERVIVVDNKSSDNTLDILKKYKDVVVIPQEQNMGFGQANNIGVRYAMDKGAEYVFLLNQDTRLRPDCIEKLMSVFAFDSSIAVASPIHLNTRGDGFDVKFESYITSRSCPGYISDSTLGLMKPFYQTVFVNAAAWIVRTSVIRQIGLFSKEFFHYGEDSNFLQRLRYFKYKVVIVPAAFIHHDRDERQGAMTEIGKKREVEINRLNLLLNINESLREAYLRILRYAGLLILQGQFFKSLMLLYKSFSQYVRLKKIRNQFLVTPQW